MKSTHVLLCCALSAIAGALICYAALRTWESASGQAATAPAQTAAMVRSVEGAPNATDVAASIDSLAPSPEAGRAAGGAADTSAGAVPTTAGVVFDPRARAARPASGAGPMLISDANLRRADAVVAEMRLHDSDLDDLYTLLDGEGRDAAWSDAAEAQLVAFLRTHGGGYDGLEVKPPRCSTSVCEMIAVAQPGLGTDAANANWQALISTLFGQDWFRNTFDSPRSGVVIRDGSVIYISTFLRQASVP
ncbi:exported hypothetical protein [Luteimonas sp. 9C]|uniref:hypothetical protein n=1 Tax=Luteimonas sp. 9C TaxID=2653148 RepID=UPI0012F03ECC|nr:hypothetical protein [Luteimonas sp. 9C]VXC02537.1 exported hypothetical protein [Luteimonas sp. 9C]